MPVNLRPPAAASLSPVPGVALGIAQAGIRKANRRDLLLLEQEARALSYVRTELLKTAAYISGELGTPVDSGAVAESHA